MGRGCLTLGVDCSVFSCVLLLYVAFFCIHCFRLVSLVFCYVDHVVALSYSNFPVLFCSVLFCAFLPFDVKVRGVLSFLTASCGGGDSRWAPSLPREGEVGSGIAEQGHEPRHGNGGGE